MSFADYIISHWAEVMDQTMQHLKLTLISISIATVTGVSVGLLISRFERLAGAVLSAVGIIQTIPSLALLGFLLPLVGIGTVPAIIALFLYALLPIVRNTYTGIKEIDPNVKEATLGMGMTQWQLLRYVELPLAFPVILAGIRTSAVINVGIATLCALIAAGGLGEFIFRGISLNNTNMILAGAIPASVLALLIDGFLGLIQRFYNTKWIWTASVIMISALTILTLSFNGDSRPSKLIAGFNAEFIERADGFAGLDSLYDLPMEIKEMEISLMYQALYEGDVDVIDGFSTDGRIEQYNLKSLIDDQNYFPPYYAVPLVNGKSLSTYPEIREALNVLEGVITDSVMTSLNYLVDAEKKELKEVAHSFLKSINIYADPDAGSATNPDLIIGSKAFTENYLLAHLFAQLIENKTTLKTKLQLGFGGTKLVFDALRYGEIDLYPEYTGTAYLVLLNKKPEDTNAFNNPDSVFHEVQNGLLDAYNIGVMHPLGFNNTFALMMRRDHADSLDLQSISDLADYLKE